jgi:Ca2+-binding RTX toxin-like protein
MSLTVSHDDTARTGSITGSAAGESIDLSALLPQSNDPNWVVNVAPGDGNDTVVGNDSRSNVDASPGQDLISGGGEWDRIKFDLSSLGLNGTLSLTPLGPTLLDPAGLAEHVVLTSGGTSTTLFTLSLDGKGGYIIEGTTPATQAAFGTETTTSVEWLEFNLGAGKGSFTVVNGTPESDWLPGTAGDDVIQGFGGDDVLWGGEAGTNYLYGGDGRDLLVGGAGIDHMDGGTGVDTASYQASTRPVIASLADPAINTGDAAGDTYVNIRQLTGTPFGATLYGDNTGQQNELFAIGGTNYLHGGLGYATLVSGPGADHMFAGPGGGFADYETSASAVTASLADPGINTGEAFGDTYDNIRDLGGSAFNDVLYGDDNGNNILSHAGDDVVFGRGGNDTINGGSGANTLSGGAGSDWFIFSGAANGPIGGTDAMPVLTDARLGIMTRISDFDQGNGGAYNVLEGDSLDIAPLLPGLFQQGNAPIYSVARVVENADGASARFQVHSADGQWLDTARLDGLHVGDTVGVLTNESKGATNIQVRGHAPPIDVGTHGVSWPISGVGDFNGDGDSDILWRSPSTGQVDSWQMKTGGWGGSIDLGATKPANWTLAGTGDFDGDGTSDVLWRDISNSQVDQWHMKNGNWAGSIDLGKTKGADWTLAGVADFNGDGTSDVLWRKIDTSQVDQWEMKNGNWSKSIDLGATKGSEWTLAGVGDFNGDGTTDVLWRSINTSQVDQWQMKNGNWSQSIDLGATKGADWAVAGIGDFNADGTSDVLWFNTKSGQEEYWSMKAGNWGGSVDLGTLNPSWKPSGVGDFNHDGASDALWLDPATGHVHEQLWML